MGTSSIVIEGVNRSIALHPPSLWGDFFLSFSIDHQAWEKYSKEGEVLKGEVRSELTVERIDAIQELVLIDTLERLGVSYHFEEEIKEFLRRIFQLNIIEDKDYDLSTVALYFRLLRQHGHKVPCSVFEKFIDKDSGKFRESLTGNVKGLLSLYEAAELGIQGEEILEEATAFSTAHLKSVVHELSSPLRDQVQRALSEPPHRGLPRVETRHYISFYEKDGEKSDLLLRFAKVDFNLLQMQHQKELQELSRWWKDLNLESKLPFTRDRMVECYFWGMSVHFEPQYSVVRLSIAKGIALTSFLDDNYDNFGTLEELEVLTESVQRWKIDENDKLPQYMKNAFEIISKVYDEAVEEVTKQGRPYAIHYAKESMKQLARSYYVEAKWFMGNKMPTLDEYIQNGIITSTYYAIITSSLFGMKSARKEVYEWLMSGPKIHVVAAIHGRTGDDMGSYKREKKGGLVPTPIDCCMQHYGVTEEEALNKFREINENTWKDINKELMNPSPIPREILIQYLNLARATFATYKSNEDAYSFPEKGLKPLIAALLVDPIVI